MEDFDGAVDSFKKVYQVLQNSAEVIYQIAHCYEKMQDAEQAGASSQQSHPTALSFCGCRHFPLVFSTFVLEFANFGFHARDRE
jgi:hypothetical protein